jgi:hypothetical protein
MNKVKFSLVFNIGFGYFIERFQKPNKGELPMIELYITEEREIFLFFFLKITFINIY